MTAPDADEEPVAAADPTTDELERQKTMERELTSKYLSGELTFQDYIREIDPEDSEEEEEEEEKKKETAREGAREDEDLDDLEDDDEEWLPKSEKKKGSGGKKVKKIRDPASAAAAMGGEETEEMVKFAQELRQTSRQQLGKKRQRVGMAPRRNKLDPALQVSTY